MANADPHNPSFAPFDFYPPDVARLHTSGSELHEQVRAITGGVNIQVSKIGKGGKRVRVLDGCTYEQYKKLHQFLYDRAFTTVQSPLSANAAPPRGTDVAPAPGGQPYGQQPQQYNHGEPAGAYQYPQRSVGEVIVPRTAVGVIIGKNGETMKRLTIESGAKIFIQNDFNAPERTAYIIGTPEQITRATGMIRDLVNRAMVNDSMSPRYSQLPVTTPVSPFTGGSLGSASNDPYNFLNYNASPGGNPNDPNAALAAYYAQYYQQPSAATAYGHGNFQSSAPTNANPQTGQQDYSSPGAEYYRSLGMHEQAALIEQQARANQQSGQQGAGVAPAPGGQRYGAYGQHPQQYNHGQPAGAYQYPHVGKVIVPRTAVGVIIGKNGETIKRLSIESGAKIHFLQDDLYAPERTALIIGTPEQITRATGMITNLVNRAMVNDSMSPRYSQNNDADVLYLHVPANKIFLVIGKGAETVKQICAESGARMELSFELAPSETEMVFVVRGTPQQIHHAQHLIRIKVGDLPCGTPVPPFPGGIPESSSNDQYNFSNYNASSGDNSSDPNAAWPAYYDQYYQQPAAAYGHGNFQSSVPTNAWSTAAPSINPQTGQPNYSSHGAEYYRSLGTHDQAAMSEQQARVNQQSWQQGAAVAPAPAGQPYGAYGQQAQQYNYGQPGGAYHYPHYY